MIHKTLLVAAACLAPAVFADRSTADSTANAEPIIYRLDEGTTYQRGCFDPCLCPIMQEVAMRGAFTLQLSESNPLFTTYTVSDINWLVDLGTEQLKLAGSGKYTIGGEVAFLQRMELDLTVGDEPVAHFDSGWVSGAGQFPTVNVLVSINGVFCFDTVLNLIANPVPADEILHYQLRPDSTFQQGCFDPCDCPLQEPRPMRGSFSLVPILDLGTYREYALQEVVLFVPGQSTASRHRLVGTGLYVHIDGFAGPMDQLQLDLSMDGNPVQHFGSELMNAETSFPEIDRVVTINNFFCFDIVLHVHAQPLD